MPIRHAGTHLRLSALITRLRPSALCHFAEDGDAIHSHGYVRVDIRVRARKRTMSIRVRVSIHAVSMETTSVLIEAVGLAIHAILVWLRRRDRNIFVQFGRQICLEGAIVSDAVHLMEPIWGSLHD